MTPLTRSQKEVRRSAVGFFLNMGCAFIFVFTTGMDSFWDWLLLVWSVVSMVGCAYYVQADIKAALRKEEGDAT